MNRSPRPGGLSTTAVIIAIMSLSAALTGCAHPKPKLESPPPSSRAPILAPTQGMARLDSFPPTTLRLKADLDRTEVVRYCARSRTRVYSEAALRSERDEATEFTVETRSTKSDLKADRLSQTVRTIKKDGAMDLREFAMPEIGEKIDFVFSSQGRVLRAGSFPESSIYFVPTVSLPLAPVARGDTWTMESSWAPIGEKAIFYVEMVSIFKEAWACGTRRCAEIEIAADIRAVAGGAPLAGYANRWRGRMLFDIDSGTVVWSRLESEDVYEREGGRHVVDSSLDGALVAPAPLVLNGLPEKASCTAAPSR